VRRAYLRFRIVAGEWVGRLAFIQP
jgi:hypothetical protein